MITGEWQRSAALRSLERVRMALSVYKADQPPYRIDPALWRTDVEELQAMQQSLESDIAAWDVARGSRGL